MTYRVGERNLTRTEIREAKRTTAARLTLARASRTTRQQLERLDARGHRALKERTRLAKKA